MDKVKVYGTDWCGDTTRTRELLERLKVPYDYINIEEDRQAAEWVKEQNDGKERKPTVQVGSQTLSVPADSELESALRESGIVS